MQPSSFALRSGQHGGPTAPLPRPGFWGPSPFLSPPPSLPFPFFPSFPPSFSSSALFSLSIIQVIDKCTHSFLKLFILYWGIAPSHRRMRWLDATCAMNIVSEVAQSCATLCNPMDCSPPGSSIHGIFQARILECVAISFSRGSYRPRDQTRSPALQADALPSEPPGKQ